MVRDKGDWCEEGGVVETRIEGLEGCVAGMGLGWVLG